MIAHTVRLAGDSAFGVATADDDLIAGHPTVNLPKDDVKKLDGVVAHLAKAKIVATRAYVVRAILRASPDGKALAPARGEVSGGFPEQAARTLEAPA
jgi:hypothetical protein